ncbi:uncharacterized protein UDID_05487 [Ustilago sp. UG-2017a]|nr:uncharacterized protein UDID_05487 [Ustilago sp. UG-2017a]
MPPPTKNRPPNRGDVSLSSTVGAPTPARYATQAYRAREVGNVSLASTAAPNKPGRPPRSALTTPAMRALADTSTSAYASSSAAPRPRGRRPKSILSTPGSRTLTSPGNASVSFSDQSRPCGRPPRFRATDIDTSASKPPPAKKRGRSSKASLAAASADASASTSMGPPAQKPRSRPPASAAKAKSKPALGLPQSATRHSRPVEEDEDSASDVSLVDGVSDEDSDASEVQSEEDEEAGMSSDDPDATVPGTRRWKAKNRKGWPSERERLRKWRRLSVEERECVTSEGGLIWRTAIPLLNSMPKNIRSMVADSLTRALNRIDGKLESGLVPPLPRIPQGTTSSLLTSSAASSARRDLASTMLSWRLEEEGALLRAENPESSRGIDTMSLGMNAEIMELEQMLLPEAEQIVELSKTLKHQSDQLELSQSDIVKLKRDRRLIKSGGTSDYPGNLEANELISITAQKPELDASLSSFLRIGSKA